MLELFGALDKLQNFVSDYGRAFYRRSAGANARRIVLAKVKGYRVEDTWSFGDATVQPFWTGKELGWQIIDVSASMKQHHLRSATGHRVLSLSSADSV